MSSSFWHTRAISVSNLIALLGPPVQRLRCKVSAIFPDDGARLKINRKPPEYLPVFERLKHLAPEHIGQINFPFVSRIEFYPYFVTGDIFRLDDMYEHDPYSSSGT